MTEQNEVQEVKTQTIAEMYNDAKTIEDCGKHCEYFIKIAFSFMKKAEQIQLNEVKKTESEV